MADVIHLIPQRERQAELWEGIVRLMESNGREVFEIGLSEVREIASIMRERANGQA